MHPNWKPGKKKLDNPTNPIKKTSLSVRKIETTFLCVFLKKIGGLPNLT